MKCPYCQEELGEDCGKYCDFCGKELQPSDDGNVAEPVMEESPEPDVDVPDVDVPDVDVPKEVRIPQSPVIETIPRFGGTRASLGEMADSILGKGKEAGKDSVGRYIEVCYATNRFLLAGGQMLLDLKLRKLEPSVCNLRICLMVVVGDRSTFKKISCDELAMGENIDLPVSLYIENEKINGMALLKFFFLFETVEGCKRYCMDVRSRIYARGQSVGSIVMTIQADGGSVNDLSGLHGLMDSCKNGDELLERANCEPPKYTPFNLVELRRVPANVLELFPYVCEMLTLEWNGMQYHLCGKQDFSIGRKWEINDFALVDWVNTASDKDDFNRHTSKRHAQIHWFGDTVNLIDTSANGTAINGVLPEVGGAGGILLPEAAVLTMGNFKLNMVMQKCRGGADYGFCKDCRCGKVRAMTLQRQDAVPECLALVWQCCDMGALGIADSRGGLLVYRRNGGFFCHLPNGQVEALVPGREIPFGGATLKVHGYVRDKFEKK